MNEEIGVLGIKEGRPIAGVSLLAKAESKGASDSLNPESQVNENAAQERYGLVYSNRSNGGIPLDLSKWRAWSAQDWDALKIHHDGGLISRSRIGNHLAMWNIYLFMLLVIFVVIDVFRWIILGLKKLLYM